jgi:hypothetical protein
MNGSGWRPAHLTPAQLEERRLAAALLRQGRLTQMAIDVTPFFHPALARVLG